MRFITEFELKHPYMPTREINSKIEMQGEMGKMIGKSFGWQESATVAFTRHTLEIEAFPMDKWLEFKRKLFLEFKQKEFTSQPISQDAIWEMIKELESFGKPAGDTIINTPIK